MFAQLQLVKSLPVQELHSHVIAVDSNCTAIRAKFNVANRAKFVTDNRGCYVRSHALSTGSRIALTVRRKGDSYGSRLFRGVCPAWVIVRHERAICPKTFVAWTRGGRKLAACHNRFSKSDGGGTARPSLVGFRNLGRRFNARRPSTTCVDPRGAAGHSRRWLCAGMASGSDDERR